MNEKNHCLLDLTSMFRTIIINSHKHIIIIIYDSLMDRYVILFHSFADKYNSKSLFQYIPRQAAKVWGKNV